MKLRSLSIQNFKCFPTFTLNLGSLTILTGYNAAGKSSSFQPLLLLAQSTRVRGDRSRLDLNGALVKLGTAGDILYHGISSREIRIGIEADVGSIEWAFNLEDSATESSVLCEDVTFSRASGGRATEQNVLWPATMLNEQKDLCDAIGSAVYLSAGRLIVTEAYPRPDSELINADVGTFGQLAAWWYARHVDDDVAPARRHREEQGLTFRRQVDAYLSDIFPGAQANAEAISGTSLVKLAFRSSGQSEWLRPMNIGFGLSYAFPMLVTLLLANEGQIVVIDSPEAHLHPKGQSQMGKFLAKMAMAGVQIIIETHSDHVLNGIRLAVLEGALSSEDVATYFFSNSADETSSTLPLSISMQPNGALSNWPSGFFDQAEEDLLVLTGLST